MKIERFNTVGYAVHYNSFEEITKDFPKTDGNKRLWDSRLLLKSRDWYGKDCSSIPEFMYNVEHGWPALTEAVQKKAAKLTMQPDVLPPMLVQSSRRKRVRADSGNELDIHRVYQGQLDTAWSATRKTIQETRRRAAHIYVNIDGNGNESAVDSQWRAAAAYRVCEILQRSGFTVEITVGSAFIRPFSNGPQRNFVTFTAKPSGMPLDLNRLSLQSTLGWMRSYLFAGIIYNDQGYDVTPSFGSADHNAIPPYISESEKSGSIVVAIPSNINNEISAMGAVRRLQIQLTNYGKAA